MITITLSAALYAFFAVLVIFVIFFFVNLHHLAEGASLTIVSFLVTVLVAAVAATLIGTSWMLLQSVDWHMPIVTFSLPTL